MTLQRLGPGVLLAWGVYLTLLAGWWLRGGAGFPLGRNDATGPESGSVLVGISPSAGSTALALLGSATVTAAWRFTSDPAGRARSSVRTAWMSVTTGALAILVVADARMILLLPPLGLLPFRWREADWPTIFQLLVVVGAALLAVAGVTRLWPPRHAARWVRAGRVATYVAMVCPLPYAAIRLCWSRGWAVGAPEPFVEALLRNQPANVWIEPVLAAFALSGAVLVWGLARPWGSRFPRWVPGLRGRGVPLWFPLGLGGSAAIGIWGFGRGILLDRLGVHLPGGLSDFQQWGQPVDGLRYWGADGLGWVLFPLWSLSLVVALIGYAVARTDVSLDRA